MHIIPDISTVLLTDIYFDYMKCTFPPAELKPLTEINRMRTEGYYTVMQFSVGDACGYVLLWWGVGRKYALIDYFFVPDGMRSNGLGSAILSKLKEYYPDVVFIIESEFAGSCDNDIASRRVQFYLRNGGEQMNYECKLYGVHYNCLYLKGNGIVSDPTESDILAAHIAIYKQSHSEEKFSANVKLPLV